MKLEIGLAMMLMAGTSALAQQTNNPTAPSNPAVPHTDPIPNQVECWDAATNRVRNSVTVGQRPGAVASAPQNQQAPATVNAAIWRAPSMSDGSLPVVPILPLCSCRLLKCNKTERRRKLGNGKKGAVAESARCR